MSDLTPESPSPVPAAALEDLLFRALERFEAEGSAGVERFLTEHPEQAALLRAHLQRLRRMGFAGGQPSAATEHPERLGEFRILEPLGHGGMGIVYRAVQESLGREVALKVIRPEQLFFPGSRERFRREVELVARMQHPGIVPVYAVGTDDGVPFFVMELVHGAPLSAVLEHLSGKDPKNLDGREFDRALAACLGETPAEQPAALFAGEWTQVVLRIVREVADALEHAHRRGVLHRDVKPSNIMLTRDGRVMLMDFGLAGGAGTERLTRTGTPLGSLAYMAPELLTGDAQTADVRADVYSLGATAWELLALRLPYQGSDPVRLREQARDASRPKLSAVNGRVSWDVETVVVTAMEPDPARRYASASLFSRDLDNLLAHRSIEARQPGLTLRLRRWTQRHPARATAAVAAGLVLLGGPSLLAWKEGQARARIEAERDEVVNANLALDKAKAEADRESVRAQSNFRKLQQAVDTMLTKVGDENLRDIPHMETVRRELLEEALRFYEGFLAEMPDDPGLQAEAAHVRLRTAEVQGMLGDYAAARELVQAAIAQLTALRDPSPAVATDLARARERLARAARVLGDAKGAEQAVQRAIRDWQAIGGDSATSEIALGLADARVEASRIAADRGDLAAALQQVEGSLQEMDGWQASHANSEALAAAQARTLDHAAVWLVQQAMQTRDRGAGMALVERAAGMHAKAGELMKRLMAAAPGDVQLRVDASQSAVNLAIALETLGRAPEARDAIEHGVTLAAALVADFPVSKRRRSELANARGNFAAVLGQLGKLDLCLEQSSAACDLWRGLVADDPGSSDYAVGLCQSLQNLAVGKWYTGTPPAQVLPLVDAAAAAADKALTIRPDNPSFRRVRRKVAQTDAEVACAAGDHVRVATDAHLLLDERLAPAEPVLAGALLARAAPLVVADLSLAEAERKGLAVAYTTEARALLRAALAGGATLSRLRGDPNLSDQWDKPGFAELCKELAPRQ